MSQTSPAAVDAPVPVPAPVRGKGLVNRVAGIIVSPRETFEDVVARPQWIGMMVLTTLVTAFAMTAFMSTRVGQEAWLQEAVRGQERWGRKMDDKQYAVMEKMASFAPAMVGIPMLVMSPLVTVGVSAILFGIMKVMTGSPAAFKQTLAVVVHGGPISMLHMLVAVPLNYIRGAMQGSTSLGIFLPFEEGSLPARIAGSIDLFLVWGIVILALGLSVLYKRRMGPIAAVLLGLYLSFSIIVGAIFG